MPKDYYFVLGITSEATLGDIKDVYRKLAKEYHPDHFGKNHSPFLSIQEAYSVLSDPIKRQTHDLEVLNQKKKFKPRYGEKIRSGLRRRVVSFPSGISDNHVVRKPLDYYGIKNLYLTVHFRISEML